MALFYNIGNSSPTFGYFQNSMRLAVPLILQKKRLEEQQMADAQKYQWLEQKLKEQADEARFKAAADFLTNTYSEAFKQGNLPALTDIAPQLQQAGLPVPSLSVQQPRQEKMNLEQLLADRLQQAGASADDIQKRLEALKSAGKGKNDFVANNLEQLAGYYYMKGDRNRYEELIKEAALLKRAGKSSTGMTPEERRRKQLEDDIQQELGRLGSIESGQDIFASDYDVGREKVIKRKRKRLGKLLESYDNTYGSGSAKRRFGIGPKAFMGDPLGLFNEKSSTGITSKERRIKEIESELKRLNSILTGQEIYKK